MTSILFVCTANQFRSPIAEACFKAELNKRKETIDLDVSSAGTWTTDGLAPMPDAIRQARELGLDIQGHHSRVITGTLLQGADLILVMEQGQKEALQIEFKSIRHKIYMLTEVVEGVAYDIPDPVNDPGNTEIISVMCNLIRAGFEKIYRLAVDGKAQI